MHELSIAQNIAQTLLQVASSNNARRVVCATLALGDLTCVEPETLTFAFEVSCQNTILAGCRLEIVRRPLTLRCDRCALETQGHPERDECQTCGGQTFTVTGGREIQLTTMDIEEGIEHA